MAKTRIPIPPAIKEMMEREEHLEKLKTPVAEILPMRMVNALEDHGGIIYVEDLLRKSPAELAEFPNFGKKTVAEITRALERLGLALACWKTQPIPPTHGCGLG